MSDSSRIKELEAENKRLFDAHSVEMLRADKLKQEVERLREEIQHQKGGGERR